MQNETQQHTLAVITVMYNAEDTLADCLDSVIEQTERNFVHLVIDGGSSDETVDILLKYGYERVAVDRGVGIVGKFFVSEFDKGIYDAMNKALDLTDSSHVIFLNSDDYFFDCDVVSRITTNLEGGELQLHGICYQEDALRRTFLPSDVTAEDIIFDRSLRRAPHPSIVFPVTDLRYDLRYKIASDYQYVIKNFRKFGRPKLFDSCSTVMVRSDDQLSVRYRDVIKTETWKIAKDYPIRGSWVLKWRLMHWIFKNFLPILRKLVGSK